ncbi:Halocyanin [Candidatus Norongarragalina meridionalis]|nr:Halocyanin [Candidatus Norongarragalina meridionalis]
MKFALLVLLSVSVLLLGCVTQDTSPAPTEQPTAVPTQVPTVAPTAIPTAAPTVVPTPTEIPTPVPTMVPSPSPASIGPTASVLIQNFAFSPPTLNIAVGTTVTWTNNDDTKHVISSVQGAPSSFFSEPLNKGSSFSVTFNHTGSYGYYCTVHPSMMGNVIVS